MAALTASWSLGSMPRLVRSVAICLAGPQAVWSSKASRKSVRWMSTVAIRQRRVRGQGDAVDHWCSTNWQGLEPRSYEQSRATAQLQGTDHLEHPVGEAEARCIGLGYRRCRKFRHIFSR